MEITNVPAQQWKIVSHCFSAPIGPISKRFSMLASEATDLDQVYFIFTNFEISPLEINGQNLNFGILAIVIVILKHYSLGLEYLKNLRNLSKNTYDDYDSK